MSRITDEYAKFKRLHSDFLNGVTGAHADLQSLLRRDREGATKLMLFWAASCLNFGSSCRTKHRKKYDEVLVEGWDSPDKFQKYCERLGKMGINMGGGYEGDDNELVYIKADGSYIEKAKHCKYLFLPLFKYWFDEAVEFANEIYPSGIMAAAMQSIRTRALNGDKKMPASDLREMLESARPSRDSVTHRVKGMAPELGMPYSGKSISKEEMILRMKEKQATLAQAFGMGTEGLKQFAKIKHDAYADMQKHSIKEKEKNMSKTNDFVNSIKGIFGATVRMQRGRATVHAVKRVIFKAFPIQWGILARLTGKAKKVEDHPLTDVAVALLAHGAASALLTDPKKRDKYLCYTEEMVAASVANAGLKMVPVEDILDKVLNGAMDSEAISKLKAVLQDQ
ncbi:MAG: hypothetical protein ACRCVV_20520 [Shewanella sp.]